jgi:hypothetical protein
MNRKYYCYAWAAGESWEALCPDLDLAASAGSPDEAQRILSESIRRHVHAGRDSAARLSRRKSPLPARLWLWAHFAVPQLLGGSRTDGRSGYRFRYPAEVAPAGRSSPLVEAHGKASTDSGRLPGLWRGHDTDAKLSLVVGVDDLGRLVVAGDLPP